MLELAEENKISVKTAMLAILLPILLVLLLIALIIVLICCFCPAVFARCGCGQTKEKPVKERIYEEVEPTVYVDDDRYSQGTVYDEPRNYNHGGPAGPYRDAGGVGGGRGVYEDPRRGPRPAGAARQAQKISATIETDDLQDRIRKVSGFGKPTNI